MDQLEHRQIKLLRQAEDADDQAKRATGPAATAAWERIAKNYRELADLAQKQPR